MYDFVEAIQSLKFYGEKFYCLCRFPKKMHRLQHTYTILSSWWLLTCADSAADKTGGFSFVFSGAMKAWSQPDGCGHVLSLVPLPHLVLPELLSLCALNLVHMNEGGG